jgi:hypothetical protein
MLHALSKVSLDVIGEPFRPEELDHDRFVWGPLVESLEDERSGTRSEILD